MNWKFDYKRIFAFAAVILIAFIFYGAYLKQHYSPDTYDLISRSRFSVLSSSMVWDNFSIPHLKMGRFGLAILLYILSLIFINPIFTNMFSNFLAMLFFAVSFFYTIDTVRIKFSQSLKEVLISTIILMPLFMNPLYCDWFQYSEVVVYFSFSFMVGTILSLKICFEQDISLKKRIMYSIIFFFCLSIHQTILNLFLIYSSLWLVIIYFNKEKLTFDTKKYIKKWLSIFLLYVSLALIQAVIVFYYGKGDRVSGSIFENILIVLQAQPSLWLMERTGKRNIILILSICMGMIGNIVLEKRSKDFLISLGYFCFLIVITFSTHILAEPWLSHRTVVFLYSMPSVFALLFYLRSKEFYNRESIFFFSLMIVMIFLNITYLIRSNNLAIFTHQNNAIDKQIAMQICNQISDYERETGIEVTKISFKNDPTLTYVNPEIFASYDMNIRTFSVPWSRKAIIEINLNRMLDEVDMPDQIYEDYFKGKDWNMFEEEQVKVIGDTAYIMVY